MKLTIVIIGSGRGGSIIERCLHWAWRSWDRKFHFSTLQSSLRPKLMSPETRSILGMKQNQRFQCGTGFTEECCVQIECDVTCLRLAAVKSAPQSKPAQSHLRDPIHQNEFYFSHIFLFIDFVSTKYPTHWEKTHTRMPVHHPLTVAHRSQPVSQSAHSPRRLFLLALLIRDLIFMFETVKRSNYFHLKQVYYFI